MRVSGFSVLIAVSVVALEAFAVAQTNPPPQDYQQPPPGYQQQPPPGYQQPPPGYQQPPPGYQQQPPGGYQQPPPQTYGYPQQPGYAPPPPPGKHGFLAIPYLGFEQHEGSTGDNFGVGFIMGGILGGRINPQFSINGELRIDILNPKNTGGDDVTAVEVDIAFSPLFHVPFQQGEFVVGPKLGAYGFSFSDMVGGVEANKGNASGYAAGFNTGVFFNISPTVALGGMLSFTLRQPTKECSTPYGYAETCGTSLPGGGDFPSEKVLGFHGGAMF